MPGSPRRNRVDPWGDLHAVADRGLFTGNRGCLVSDDRQLVRHHQGTLWITCLTEFKGRRKELDTPRRWTPLFFLDDAVALAAGHRPCGECRPAAYRAFRDGVTVGLGAAEPVPAGELNRRLGAERLVRGGRGRGLERAGDRRLWRAAVDALPPGTVVADEARRALLVTGDAVRPFGFDGWGPTEAPPAGEVAVLTPPTSVLALAHGFEPVLHPSAEPEGSDGPDAHSNVTTATLPNLQVVMGCGRCGGFVLKRAYSSCSKAIYHAAKRLFDLATASILLVIAAPLMAAITVAIVVLTGTPILSRQSHLGRNGVSCPAVRTLRTTGRAG